MSSKDTTGADTSTDSADSTDSTDPGDAAATSAAYAKGAAMMERIYNGAVPVLPEGTMVFNDVMMRTLFAEVWDRDVLPVRDRRLMLMEIGRAHV